MKPKPTIFVTGATGYLGGHFLEGVPRKNLRLRCLTRQPLRRAPAGVEWVKGDLCRKGSWEKKLTGCSAVVHLATYPLLQCEQHPMAGARVIMGGLCRLLECVRRHRVKRLIMASSAEVYGSPSRLPVGENAPLRPLSAYGFLKGCADLYALSAALPGGFSVCTLRFFNLYGTGTDGSFPRTVLWLFVRQLLAGKPIILHASRRNSRDFLHVKDAARALWLAVRNRRAKGVINVGSGRETPLLEAARRMARLAGRSLAIDFRPAEGRLRRTRADNHRARRLLGFAPKVSLDQGLREVLDGFSRDMKKRGGPVNQAKKQ